MTAEEIVPGAEIIVPARATGNAKPYRLRVDKVHMRSKATGAVEVGGTLLRMSGARSSKKRAYRVVVLTPERVRLATDSDGA
jgi:hypothetical protein